MVPLTVNKIVSIGRWLRDRCSEVTVAVKSLFLHQECEIFEKFHYL